ncbi:MAG: glucose 1-dehydrogenase [Pseudomonadota bacterium]|nr:glucose 1-dehydrogenase [Pseudomonadota bacterium]
MIDMDGKVALISGGARGQGAAEARLFASLGAKVVIGDLLCEEGEEVARSIGPQAAFCRLDVTSEQDWQAAVALTLEKFGKLNVLVNNAGISGGKFLEDETEEGFMKMIQINQLGVFLGMKSVVAAMRAAGGGSIVNISSTAGFRGVTKCIAYSASKWAVRGMTKTAAIELGRDGIRVNSVHPGVINTAMVKWDEIPDKQRDMVAGMLPLARIGEVSEVAQMVTFLASDASSYSTGGEFIIDGGSTAGTPFFQPKRKAKA